MLHFIILVLFKILPQEKKIVFYVVVLSRVSFSHIVTLWYFGDKKSTVFLNINIKIWYIKILIFLREDINQKNIITFISIFLINLISTSHGYLSSSKIHEHIILTSIVYDGKKK